MTVRLYSRAVSPVLTNQRHRYQINHEGFVQNEQVAIARFDDGRCARRLRQKGTHTAARATSSTCSRACSGGNACSDANTHTGADYVHHTVDDYIVDAGGFDEGRCDEDGRDEERCDDRSRCRQQKGTACREALILRSNKKAGARRLFFARSLHSAPGEPVVL
ncbi:MAG TPA: hypothetical protein VES91_07200, partial [Burkholderiaceae bacterium]|nr:hypothetical protein [Burkholderiaceae bacterium]